MVEVVLSIQFEPISGLTTAHVGLLWQRYRGRLSVIEEHPPLLPQSEHFGPPSPPRVNVAIEDKPPTPRVWFLNEQKTELVQVQNDRFAHNWRKVGRGQAYPRYENIRDRFREEVSGFEQFVDENLGTLSVSQCELTYVNHIEQSETWGRHGQVEQVFRNWSPFQVVFSCLSPRTRFFSGDSAFAARTTRRREGFTLWRSHHGSSAT